MRPRPILPFMPDPTPIRTVDDYFALDDEGETELLDGEFVVNPAPGIRHQMAVVALASLLHRQVVARRLGLVLTGPFDVVLSRTNVPHPDVLVIATASLPRLSDTLDGPPDLAVEFLSPGNASNDLKRKMNIYLEHRVPHYWIGDPQARTIRILENSGRTWSERGTFGPGAILRPAWLPGVEIPLDEVYADPR